MKRGIYIIANDRVIDQAISLLNSIREYDSETPVILVPYDNNCQGVAAALAQQHQVEVYEDLPFIDRLSRQLQSTFGKQFFARPNQFRKQACWFGPFDEFLYIDTDIIVFDKIIHCLNYLSDYDFVCYDYQYLQGIKNVFTPKVLSDRVFSKADLQGIFNCGFWGAKKALISEAVLYETFSECSKHPEYFDFSQKTSDQPIINYMILKRISRRFNVAQQVGGAAGNWAGSSHFQYQGMRLLDPCVNQPLQYLHWAGFKIVPGCPYWDIWKHYRYLHEPAPNLFKKLTRRLFLSAALHS
ncbi:MAG: methionine synthase [Chroococcidiopsidaceae cyanobacterium CP_BM_RX_35]|nr:methionine synthase [Chroococcidiopsidaceae cyanobacterium CP_BM_RX_35]